MVPVRRHACNWLAYLAAGGLVLAFLIVTASAREDDLDLADHLQQPVPSSADTQSQHQTGPPKEHQHSGDAPSSAPETSSPFPTGQPKDKNRIAAKPENEGEWYTKPDWWMVGFTGFLFIATAGIWFFTALLWRATRRAVSDGEKSVAGSDLSSQKQLRAYVIVHTAHLEDIEIGKTPRARVELKNYGQTPAYDVRHRVEIGFSEFPPTGGIPLLEVGEHDPKMLIGPGGHINAIRSLGQVVAHNDLAALQNVTHAIFVVGTVNYRDAFNESRITHYLFFANGHHSKGILGPYSTGNSAT